MFNDYGANTPLLIIGFFEFAVIGWLYGVRRFNADIDSMIGPPTKWYGKAARWYFKICMWFIAPVLLVRFISSFLTHGDRPSDPYLNRFNFFKTKSENLHMSLKLSEDDP